MFEDPLIYSILGLLGAIPLVFLTAALRGVDTFTASRDVMSYLEEFGRYGQQLSPNLKKILGFSASFVFLYCFALFFSHAGKGLMPHLRFIPHLSNEVVDWKLDHQSDWRVFRDDYRKTFDSDPEFQEKLRELDLSGERGSRTGFMMALLLSLSGIVDLIRRRFSRGLITIGSGIILAIVIYSLWLTEQGRFVRAIVVDNARLGQPAELPQSMPPELLRVGEARERQP